MTGGTILQSSMSGTCAEPSLVKLLVRECDRDVGVAVDNPELNLRCEM